MVANCCGLFQILSRHMHGGVRTTETKQSPWPLVRKRTIPAERRPLVGETLCQLLRMGGGVSSGQGGGSPGR
jgi:hypothetical protein